MKKLLLLALCVVSMTVVLQAQVKETSPPPPPPLPKVVDVKVKAPTITIEGKQAEEFYTRNPSVTGISRQGNMVRLTLKDKTSEKYNMSKKEEKKSFTDKYGAVPIPDPPPLPPVPQK
jgi:hypothetical protein